MNISGDRLRQAYYRRGKPADDRSEFVKDALSARVTVGYREGRPVVPPEDGRDDSLRLGDVGDYSHYKRRQELLSPSAGPFLKALRDAPEIGSVEDMAAETNSDEATVRKALSLHGLEPPEPSDETDEKADGFRLPSGETLPEHIGPLHPLSLAQMFSDGMGLGEIADYVSAETGEHVTRTEVHAAAERVGLIPSDAGTSTSRDTVRPAKRTETVKRADPSEHDRTPWSDSR